MGADARVAVWMFFITLSTGDVVLMGRVHLRRECRKESTRMAKKGKRDTIRGR